MSIKCSVSFSKKNLFVRTLKGNIQFGFATLSHHHSTISLLWFYVIKLLRLNTMQLLINIPYRVSTVELGNKELVGHPKIVP